MAAEGSLPNGLCFDADGTILIANWGTERLERMTRDGQTTVLLDRIDGQPLGKVNFVASDGAGRLWLTVTTRMQPWTDHLRTLSRDGYIAVIDQRGARIVADGLCGTNELRFDASGKWFLVAETTARHVTRFRVEGDRLAGREVYGPTNLGGFCDGIALDAFGNLWTTLVMADRLVAITPEGDLRTVYLGSLQGRRIPFFRSPVAGLPLPGR